MGLETILKTKVGDSAPAVAATLNVTITDAAVTPGNVINVTIPGTTPLIVALTEGIDFNQGTGDNALAAALAALIHAINGVNAVAVANVITLSGQTPGAAGNGIIFAAANQAGFNSGGTPKNLSGGLDANQPQDMEFRLDEDDFLHFEFDGVEVGKAKFSATEHGNTKPFKTELQNWLRKVNA